MRNFAKPTQLELKNSTFGSLGVIEFSSLDFVPKRIYWISNVPEGSERGQHAHKTLTQLICLLTGTVEIEISDGDKKTSYYLDRHDSALRLEPGLWRVLRRFSQDACVLVICDQPYDESDYIRNYDAYLEWHSKKNA